MGLSWRVVAVLAVLLLYRIAILVLFVPLFILRRVQRLKPQRKDRLLTIPFSHFCEKSRWMLLLSEKHRDFVEEGHAPLLHSLYSVFVTGGFTSAVPILVEKQHQSCVYDSVAITKFLAQQGDAWLLPNAQASELEKYFGDVLGVHVRILAYAYLLRPEATPLLRRVLLRHLTGWELAFCERYSDVLVSVLRLAFKAEYDTIEDLKRGTAKSLAKVEQVFDRVAQVLEQQKSTYLAGDRLSAADLSFAALAAPLLLPAELSEIYPLVDDLGPELAAFREQVERFRNSPAGRFALSVYKRHRSQ